MNRAGVIVGALVIIAAIGIAAITLVRTYHPTSSPTPEQSGNGNASVGASGASSVITYTDKGFSPSPLTINVGTTVTWVNQGSQKMWVEAADSSRGDCPNTKTALNECQAVSVGGTYSYTFTNVGTFPYINQVNISDSGSITVTKTSSAGPINPRAIPE